MGRIPDVESVQNPDDDRHHKDQQGAAVQQAGLRLQGVHFYLLSLLRACPPRTQLGTIQKQSVAVSENGPDALVRAGLLSIHSWPKWVKLPI